MRFIAGEDLNFLARANAVTSNPPAHVHFPASNLGDSKAVDPFAFVGLSVDPHVTIDLDMMGGAGNLETWPDASGTPSGWKEVNTGTGSVIRESTNVHSGTYAAALAGGASGVGQIQKDITVRSGQRLNIDAQLRGSGTVSARMRIQNVHTGKYYNPATSAWQTAAVDVAARSIASYAQTLLEFVVEGWTACQRSTVTLRVMALCNEDGTAYVDAVSIYPSVNFVSIHGHNIDVSNTLQLRSSTDNFSAVDTLEADFVFAPREPSFFAYAATAIRKRYVRLKFVGTNTTTIYMGELVVTHAETTRAARWGSTTTFIEDQVRQATPQGEVTAFPLSEHGRRGLGLDFQQVSETQHLLFRDDIVRRCRGGRYPVLIVPRNVEDVVILGKLDSSWAVARALPGLWTNGMVIAESPFPTVLNIEDADEVFWMLDVDGAMELDLTTNLS